MAHSQKDEELYEAFLGSAQDATSFGGEVGRREFREIVDLAWAQERHFGVTRQDVREILARESGKKPYGSGVNHWLGATKPEKPGRIRKLVDKFNEHQKTTRRPGRLQWKSVGRGGYSRKLLPVWESEENPAVVQSSLDSLADRWLQSGLPYHEIVALEGQFQLDTDVRERLPRANELGDATRIHCFAIALHFSLSWPSWVGPNRDDPVAIRFLLSLVHNKFDYERPAMRALYALQECEMTIIEAELGDLDAPDWLRQTMTFIVFPGHVKKHLESLASEGGRTGDKARAVLDEIEAERSLAARLKLDFSED